MGASRNRKSRALSVEQLEDRYTPSVVGPVLPSHVGPGIIDDGDPGFGVVGAWQTYRGPEVFGYDVKFKVPGDLENIAYYDFTVRPGVPLQIAETHLAHPLAAPDAYWVVFDGDGSGFATALIDQRAAADDFKDAGTSWDVIAPSFVPGGNTIRVVLYDSPNGYVEADAVRVEEVGHAFRILDDADEGFLAIGTWKAYQGPEVFDGDVTYAPPLQGSAQANWQLGGLAPGSYRVAVTWFRHPDAGLVNYYVKDADLPVGFVQVDQRSAPVDFQDAGVWWADLGTFTINSTLLNVSVTQPDGISYFMADAIRVERVL